MARTFVWADLSTFDLKAASEFYGQCFDWYCQNLSDEYQLLLAGKDPVGGIYTMPEQFQGIGMPSFWMSYIHVNDIQRTVSAAVEHGGKVEIPPQPAHGGGLIALIRDPAGAGFTCYEGDAPGSNDQSGRHGHIVWSELHVSDLVKIEPFYCGVFGWDIRPCEDTDRFLIFGSTSASNAIAGVQVTGNHIKGDKEYWGVYISVNSLTTTSKIVQQHGGGIVAEQPLGNQPALLVNDPQGAAFYVIEGLVML